MKTFFLALLFLLVAASAEATTRWVSTSGSGSTCSSGTPCSLSTGLAATVAGDTLNVKTGTYSGSINATGITGGTAGTPTTIIAVDGPRTVTLSGGCLNVYGVATVAYITFDGFVCDGNTSAGNITVYLSHHITIQNGEIKNTNVLGMGAAIQIHTTHDNVIRNMKLHDLQSSCDAVAGTRWYGIYLSTSTDTTTIEDNELYNLPGGGIQIYTGSHTNTTIRRNIFRNNPTCGTSNIGGIYAADASNLRIYNNLIYRNTNPGIEIDRTATALIANNVSFANTGPGLQIDGGTGITVQNNIFRSNASGQFTDSGTATVKNYNYCDSGCTGANSVNSGTSPFLDEANNDFRLASKSGATGVGVSLASTFTTDFANTTRTVPWDIGAYAVLVTTPSCPSTPALVAQYSFDGVATDSSGNTNTATLASGVTYVTGKYGQGVQAAAAGIATVPHSSTLFLCTGFTIAMWVQLGSTVSDFAALLTSNYDSLDGWFFYAGSSGYGTAGAPIGGYALGGGSNATAIYSTPLTTTMTHVAVTYDYTLASNNLKLWVNGANVTSANGVSVLGDWSGNMCIGCSPYGEYLPSGSIVDEIRIYNYARTAGQITTDMNTPISPLAAPSLKVSGTMKFGAGSAALKLPGGS